MWLKVLKGRHGNVRLGQSVTYLKKSIPHVEQSVTRVEQSIPHVWQSVSWLAMW